MNKRDVEALERIIGRLEAWQNNPRVYAALQKLEAHHSVNVIKSSMLRLAGNLAS